MNKFIIPLFTLLFSFNVLAGGNNKVCLSLFLKEEPRDLVKKIEVKEKTPEEIEALKKKQVQVLKLVVKYFKQNARLPREKDIAAEMEISLASLREVYTSKEAYDLMQEYNPGAFDIVKNKVLSAFTKVAKEKQEIPTLAEVAIQMGIEARDLRFLIGEGKLFKTERSITVESYKKNQKAFEDVRDTGFFTKEREQKTLRAIKESPNIIVTGAVAGMPVDSQVWADLIATAKSKKAPIIIIPSYMRTSGLDPVFFDTPDVHILTNTTHLSELLSLNTVKVLPTNLNPLTSLEVFGKRDQSQIVSSPKMHMKTVATYDNPNTSHILYSTGVVTKPYYNRNRPSEKARDARAAIEHRYGGLILEKSLGSDRLLNVPVNGFFHIRQLKYDQARKGFVDLDTFYSEGSIRKENPSAVVYGDIHFGDTDRAIEKNFVGLKDLNPDYVVLHDTGNGKAVSHWDAKDYVLSQQKAVRGLSDVRAELMADVSSFNALLSINKKFKIIVVLSNHDQWHARWIRTKAFMEDPYNRELGEEFALAMMRDPDLDPYAYFILKHVDDPSRLIFMESGESFKVGTSSQNLELALHGDRGTNGAKGSLRTYQLGTDGVVYGHTHTSEIKNEVVNTGTTTKLVLDYMKGGLSNWNQAMTIISKGGLPQLVQFLHGEWHNGKSLSKEELSRFFSKDYPAIVPTVEELKKEKLKREANSSTFEIEDLGDTKK